MGRKPNVPMISLRRLRKKYDKVLKDFPTDENFIATITNYICAKDHVMKCISRTNGVTSYTVNCHCGLIARSSMGKDNFPDVDPQYEWVRPKFDECMRMRKKGQTDLLEHILKGGLQLKYIGPVYQRPVTPDQAIKKVEIVEPKDKKDGKKSG